MQDGCHHQGRKKEAQGRGKAVVTTRSTGVSLSGGRLPCRTNLRVSTSLRAENGTLISNPAPNFREQPAVIFSRASTVPLLYRMLTGPERSSVPCNAIPKEPYACCPGVFVRVGWNKTGGLMVWYGNQRETGTSPACPGTFAPPLSPPNPPCTTVRAYHKAADPRIGPRSQGAALNAGPDG